MVLPRAREDKIITAPQGRGTFIVIARLAKASRGNLIRFVIANANKAI